MNKRKKEVQRFETKIHVFRAMKRMTQKELADKVNVSRQTIVQLERNKYNPSFLLMHRIARVFDVSTEKLIDVFYDDKDENNE